MAKPLAPAEIRLSIAATWPSLSPSNLPAKALQLKAELLGFRLGASRIFTKNGLPSVLVIRPTMSAAKADPPTPSAMTLASEACRIRVLIFTLFSLRAPRSAARVDLWSTGLRLEVALCRHSLTKEQGESIALEGTRIALAFSRIRRRRVQGRGQEPRYQKGGPMTAP
jgi:hypothetical protein